MRFGFKVPHQATSWAAVRDMWRVGDQLEVFESAWTYDHLIGLQPVDGEIVIAPERPLLDGWTLLAALACETQRLRIGNLVTCVPLRHPAVLAKMITTVDAISGGRLELGLGAGWMEPEAAMFGIDLGSPGDRLDRLEETLQVLTRLVTGASVDHHGRYYRLTQARLSPALVHAPRIWVGGNGEKRTLRLVARYADAWNYTALRPGGELDQFRAKSEILAQRCAEVGREPSEVLVSAQLSLGAGPAALAELAAAWGESGAQYVIVMLPEGASPGLLEELALALQPLRAD